jgi:hypothetical protein
VINNKKNIKLDCITKSKQGHTHLGEITNSNLIGRRSKKVRALVVNLKLAFEVEGTSKLDSADLDDE